MKVIQLLRSLVFLAACTTIFGVTIDCYYRNYSSGSPLGSRYECWASITNTANPETITEVSGTHLTGKSDADVESFFISGHRILNTIPKGIEKFFPNLLGLDWSQGNLTTIDASTLESFPNLVHLELHQNRLVTLDGNLFQYTTKLRQIGLNYNQLAQVGHDLLTGLTYLTNANFLGNPCINASASANTPQEIQQLNLQLPISCPPLAITTPPQTTTSTQATTTTPPPPTTQPATTSSDPATTTISTTSEPNECPIACRDENEELRVETADLRETTNKQREIIVELNEQADEMKRRINYLENLVREIEIPIDRIEELERVVREQGASPCSCNQNEG